MSVWQEFVFGFDKYVDLQGVSRAIPIGLKVVYDLLTQNVLVKQKLSGE